MLVGRRRETTKAPRVHRGIAGPGGGSEDKPVGTVWIAWKRRGGYAKAEVFHFDGDRDAVRRQTVASALAGLEQHIE